MVVRYPVSLLEIITMTLILILLQNRADHQTHLLLRAVSSVDYDRGELLDSDYN